MPTPPHPAPSCCAGNLVVVIIIPTCTEIASYTHRNVGDLCLFHPILVLHTSTSDNCSGGGWGGQLPGCWYLVHACVFVGSRRRHSQNWKVLTLAVLSTGWFLCHASTYCHNTSPTGEILEKIRFFRLSIVDGCMLSRYTCSSSASLVTM